MLFNVQRCFHSRYLIEYLCYKIWNPWVVCPGLVELGHIVVQFLFVFLKNFHINFPNGCTSLHSKPASDEAPLFPTSLRHPLVLDGTRLLTDHSSAMM